MQPTNAPTAPIHRYVKPIIYGGIIILLFLLSFAYWYSQKQKADITKASVGPNTYTYNKLDSFKLESSIPGGGASFSKPVEYKNVYISDDKNQASFSHTLSAPKYVPLGSLHIAASHNTNPYSNNYLNFLNSALSNNRSNDYKALVEPIHQFVSSRISPLYQASFSPAKKFTSGNLKGNAWVINFKATPKKSVTTANSLPQSDDENFPLPTDPESIKDATNDTAKPKVAQTQQFENYEGQVLFAVSKQANYYIATFNTDYNWKNNTSTWIGILNSLKIDQ